MTHIDLATVRALEERSFNAWPARQTVFFNGWVFRLAGGYTKRANSVNAADPGATFEGVRAAAETFYERHGLPAVFRLSPLAQPEADKELADAGYAFFDPTQVARASLAAAARHPSVSISTAATSAWLEGITAALGVTSLQDELHRAILRSIALPAAFATLHEQGEAIGFGLAVLERGAVGLYDIVVDPARRRRGHGRALTRALMDWGRETGASSAYLQVREQNEAARRLYAELGFEDFYRYHYRVPGHAS
ncbi:GNAT family N-acetyltransferase [Variovorax sp. J2P1-59]|uniref:GNAT family N-acetyltransferase n=1 Tax=Variovorax flavidus TaxID=3053501 RepID=UPI0025786C50|nr:GNAT family N-acetyltransferase [Variovorax sp. J2P1-59]MDM0075206.1 GNAT family N-acetyltransferase [Variovorax sp. J2P1-59]